MHLLLSGFRCCTGAIGWDIKVVVGYIDPESYNGRNNCGVNRFLVIIRLGLIMFSFVKCGLVKVGESAPLEARSKVTEGRSAASLSVWRRATGFADVAGGYFVGSRFQVSGVLLSTWFSVFVVR